MERITVSDNHNPDTSIYVKEYGTAQSTPILFLHGSMVAGWMWAGQVEDLPQYHCIVPDLPGFGNSGNIPWVSIEETSRQIADLIAKRCPGGKAHLVGLSLGAIIALHTAASNPDSISSLIVSGLPDEKIPTAWRLLSRLMIKVYCQRWGAGLLAWAFGMPDEESIEAFVTTASKTDCASLDRVMAELYSSAMPDNLAEISMPVLAVVGERDSTIAKRGVTHLQSRIPRMMARMVPGAGHQWNAEERDLFSQMVRDWVEHENVSDEFIRL
ncbi:MAG: alpha/beta hydrolase [Chromatiales bacterium]|nr:alpha/beta hydrolase [Chromatiales bacterium]